MCDARAGFTLVEMLIAVAAIGLIAVGLGKLFEKTSETVKLGRRVSNLNETAAMMERTMREDFSRMSRNGFLVIRHRLAPDSNNNGPQAIGLTKDDLAARERRVDEIMFFLEGRFFSKRDPVNPARYPIGTAARIYYGHGLPQSPSRSESSEPEVNDSNVQDPRLAQSADAPSFGQPGPSQFASKFILLRHETVLSPPQLTSLIPGGGGAPEGVVDARLTNRWADSKIQVGLQPAAADIFRVIAENYNDQVPSANNLVRGEPIRNPGPQTRLPRFESGIVDVAATDLSQIRARVLNAQELNPTRLQSIDDAQGQSAPFALERLNVSVTANGAGRDPYRDRLALGPGESVAFVTQDPTQIALGYNAPAGTGNVPTTGRMKEWMIQAMPAGFKVPTDSSSAPERRMRCEASPPNLNGVVTGTQVYGVNNNQGNQAFRRTDQAMLSASNFVVGCTEFIVEWSFGERYPSATDTVRSGLVPSSLHGQLIWHGLPRTADVNANNTVDNDEYVAHPYNSSEEGMRALSSGQYRPVQTQFYEGYTAPAGRGYPRAGYALTSQHVFQTPLIHDPPPARPGDWSFPRFTNYNETELYSCFGYVDPTFGYIPPRGTPGNNGPEPVTPRPGEPQSVSVPWPKLIRVTISLVEASEPLKEQTYQFIFELPREGDQLPGT
jgi:prepilin-type N-terminal cleavage/methylation domain-containing protein